MVALALTTTTKKDFLPWKTFHRIVDRYSNYQRFPRPCPWCTSHDESLLRAFLSVYPTKAFGERGVTSCPLFGVLISRSRQPRNQCRGRQPHLNCGTRTLISNAAHQEDIWALSEVAVWSQTAVKQDVMVVRPAFRSVAQQTGLGAAPMGRVVARWR